MVIKREKRQYLSIVLIFVNFKHYRERRRKLWRPDRSAQKVYAGSWIQCMKISLFVTKTQIFIYKIIDNENKINNKILKTLSMIFAIK